MKREPAVIIAALAALVQGVAIYTTGDAGVDTSWLLPILTVVAGVLTRQRVSPTNP